MLDSSDTFLVDLVDAATSDNDLLDITSPTGIFNLGGAVLDGLTSLSIQVGDSFTILQTARPNGVVGHFAGFDTTPVVGGSSATIAYIGGVKYVVDYFPDHVAVTRELANVAITLTPSIPAPVYGQPESFTATLTPEPGRTSGLWRRHFHPRRHRFRPANRQWRRDLRCHDDGPAFGGEPQHLRGLRWPRRGQPGRLQPGQRRSAHGRGRPSRDRHSPDRVGRVADLRPEHPPHRHRHEPRSPRLASANTLVPQGSVSFFRDNGTLMGTGTLDASGVATFDTATLATPIVVGSHNFQAVYNSDGVPDNYNASTSSNVTRFISKASTGTSVVTSGSPTVFGQPVTFTATVTPLARARATQPGPSPSAQRRAARYRRGQFQRHRDLHDRGRPVGCGSDLQRRRVL